MAKTNSLSRGNALVVVLLVVVVMIPIGFMMISRTRSNVAETKRIYQSFVLEQAARSGIEAMMDQVRLNDFSSGPHSASVADGVSYNAYLDTSGIGLVGQKICNLYSQGLGEGGGSVLVIATVEVYPESSGFLLIPHSYQLIRESVNIESYSSRAALLNSKKAIYRVFLDQVKLEGDQSLTEYEENLENLASQLDHPELQKIFEMNVIPELISQKSGF